MRKKQYRTVFISDIHLWHLKNQWDKLVAFLSFISFENLVIVGDFIDYRQLSGFWKWWTQETETLNYINDLARNWVNVTYIQWNHDRALRCEGAIHVENMTILRNMYYETLKWKVYYVTHWDCMDWINKNWNKMWQLWSIVFWGLLRLESFWNKDVWSNSRLSLAEKFEEWIKKVRMPDSRISGKIEKFIKNLACDWLIIGHFHVARHYEIDGIDYFNTWDWLKNCSAVVEDLEWNLELIVNYK